MALVMLDEILCEPHLLAVYNLSAGSDRSGPPRGYEVLPGSGGRRTGHTKATDN